MRRSSAARPLDRISRHKTPRATLERVVPIVEEG
jgi:hypothetical protein